MRLLYLIALFFVFSTPLSAKLNVQIESPSAILINSKTGKVLFEKNASQRMYPASCTKIAFALYAIKFHEKHFQRSLSTSKNAVKCMHESQKSKDNFSLVPSYVLETDASHMGLKVGEELTFYDLLEATMVVSADDASNMIAEVMGDGSIEKCVDDVNRYVTSLGLTSTHFTNPHGLHHPDHFSTAQDLAKLAQEAMKEPIFRKLAKQERFVRPKTNKQPSVQLPSTNRLLLKGSKAHYAPAIGIKTGYHRRAGYCLVAAAEEKGRSLIAVVLQGATRDDRFQDTTKLFKAAFNEEKITKTYLTTGPKPFSKEIKGGTCKLHTYTSEPISLSYYPTEEPEVRCQLVWHKMTLPVQKDASVGELLFHADGQIVQRAPLFAANSVEETLSHALFRHLSSWTVVGFLGLVAIGLCMLLRKGKFKKSS